ncbi:MAG: hypothetical protein GXP43_01865, partial [bacterium]|nr:hypothetical protein [bacterium]
MIKKHQRQNSKALPAISISQAAKQDIDEIVKLGNEVEEFQVSDEVVTFWPKHVIANIIKSKTDFIIIAKDQKQIIG